MEPSDDDLMAGCAGGDRDAFSALYRRRRPDVYRFALHMTGSVHAAEDIAQDVFMTVIRDAHRYLPGRSGVVPWLLGIARNHVRRRAAERALHPLSALNAAALRMPGNAANDVERDDEIQRLRAAIVRLPRRYREVVVLCDLQELTYAEAAEAIGCATGTVRSRLHRGRARLALALGAGAGARWPVPKWMV
jgi:RNA polymerase sigma-70 factor (ECF subfamily)